MEELEKPRFIFAHVLIDYIHVVSKRIVTIGEKQRDVQRLDSIRWFSVLLLALIAGGKIATATRALTPRTNGQITTNSQHLQMNGSIPASFVHPYSYEQKVSFSWKDRLPDE